MMIDLKLERHPVVFIGKGYEFMQKIAMFSREAAVYAFTSEKIRYDGVEVISDSYDDALGFVKEKRPGFTFISTEDEDLDRELASKCSAFSRIVYVPDKNDISDINLCALLSYGPITIGVSTRGKSPAMTVMIKKRLKAMIEKSGIIGNDDGLAVEAIYRNRTMIISSISDKSLRKKIMYRLAVDRHLRSMGNRAMEDGYIRSIVEKVNAK